MIKRKRERKWRNKLGLRCNDEWLVCIKSVRLKIDLFVLEYTRVIFYLCLFLREILIKFVGDVCYNCDFNNPKGYACKCGNNELNWRCRNCDKDIAKGYACKKCGGK